MILIKGNFDFDVIEKVMFVYVLCIKVKVNIDLI